AADRPTVAGGDALPHRPRLRARHCLDRPPPVGNLKRSGHSPKGATTALLPLGRRCPEGADEGALTRAEEVDTQKKVAPHQFGRMTYGRAAKRVLVVRDAHAAVSHGLTSSPPRGEGSVGRPSSTPQASAGANSIGKLRHDPERGLAAGDALHVVEGVAE